MKSLERLFMITSCDSAPPRLFSFAGYQAFHSERASGAHIRITTDNTDNVLQQNGRVYLPGAA
jgi:hypothetical protein